MRNFRTPIVLGFLAVAVFAASFLGTQRALAHGEHCGGVNPPCNTASTRYYAAQLGPAWDGIKGSLFVETNNDIKDESQDFVLHYLNLTNFPPSSFTCGGISSSIEWAQVGTWDGVLPTGSPNDTQYVYYESCSSCPSTYGGGGYQVGAIDVTPVWGTYERLGVYMPRGGNTSCGAISAQLIFIGRGGTDVTFALFRSAPDQASAQTEHLNRHAHEPNSLVCFGTAFTCAPSATEGLQFYTASTNTWALWTSPAPSFIETNNLLYNHVQHANYYSFITHRQ